jgi:hypothetical protein
MLEYVARWRSNIMTIVFVKKLLPWFVHWKLAYFGVIVYTELSVMAAVHGILLTTSLLCYWGIVVTQIDAVQQGLK